MKLLISFRSAVFLCICCLAGSPMAACARADQTSRAAYDETSWGRIIPQSNGAAEIKLEVQKRPSKGKLVLPATLPQISAAFVVKDQTREFMKWSFDESFRQVQLEIPDKGDVRLPINVLLESGEKSGQLAEGRIVFLASDAQVMGAHVKLKSNGVNHRIGEWSDSTDAVSWEFKPTRWGMYDIELGYSAEEGNEAEWQVDVAGKTLTVAASSTGGAERYGIVKMGRIYLEKAEPFTVQAGCKALKGGSTMHLKAVTLRPAPEGQLIAQGTVGAVTLHGSNAITHSVMMRYEPAEKKRCLGYWVNPADWAEWTFELMKSDTYEIELWQGCGKGQGGSEVEVRVNGENFRFMVEETGHFQNFVPRRIGNVKFAAPGRYSLEVRPLNKKAAAVMDIQQIKLIPVDKR